MRNKILQNNEGISPVLGFILMLAVGVTILSTVQLSFVPVWNTQEELNHLKLMQDDFKVLKSNIDSGILGGTTLSSPLIMGFKYSPKMLVYNPKDEAYASLEVRKDAWVEVRYNEVFPEGMTDDTSIKNVSTGMMIYALQGAKNYNSFIYENGLIRRSGSNFTTSSQTVLANGTIYLPSVKALDYGSLSGVEKKTVNIYPTSQQKNSVIGRNVWLILRTKPDPGGYVEWWAKTLESEGAGIRKKDFTNGIVIANVSESLVIKMGEAYITASPKASPAHSPPKRLVRVSGSGTVLPVGGTTSITVEVQDEYNNPVPNVAINFDRNETTTGHPSNSYLNAIISPDSAVSGSDGRASVMLTANDAGFYYIDASLTDYKTTLVYSASSQGSVLTLGYSGTDPEYTITARLFDSLGSSLSGELVTFDTGDGFVIPPSDTTSGSGRAYTTLNVSNATGIRITNIRIKDTSRHSANISWDTVNNITVTAKSGYVFNSIDIPTAVDASGCVFYGTSPGNHSTQACDVSGSSHTAALYNLLSGTAYYFIVNGSRLDGSSMNSTEYMFVTEGTGDDTPPGSVTNLKNVTYEPLYIRWTWNDPADADFDHVDVMIDDVLVDTVEKSVQSFNATYLMPNSDHNISLRTVDTSNNANGTWVTHNASTRSLLTYVFSFSNESGLGIVTGDSNAQNDSDGGAYALLNETYTGGSSMTENYTYVSSNTTTNGTISNWINMQSNTSAYATMTEGANSVNASYWWEFNTTTESWTHIWSGTSGTTTNGWVNDGNPAGSIYSDLNTGSNSIRTRTSTWTSPNFTWNGGTPTSASLYFDWKVEAYEFVPGSYYVNLVKPPDASIVRIYPTTTYSSTAAWSTKSNTSLTLSDFSQSGNYQLQLIAVLNTPGSGATQNVDVRWDNPKITLDNTTYNMNITTDTSSIPESPEHYLEINYSSDSNDTYGLYVYDGTTWNNRRSLTAVLPTWENFSYLLTPSEYNNGARVRYLDDTPGGISQGNLFIDYQRVHNVTPAVTPGYHLDIIANTTGIPEASSQMLQLKYNVTGDNFTLQVYNGSAYDNRTTLNKTGSMDSISLPLSGGDLQWDGIFTPYSAKILNRYKVLVRYIDEDPAKQGKLYLDYQRVNSS